MSTVQEIETAIAKLSSRQFQELMRRMDERRAGEWDQQIEKDAQNGNLDRLQAALDKENAGRAEVSLDDFLDEMELPKKIRGVAEGGTTVGD